MSQKEHKAAPPPPALGKRLVLTLCGAIILLETLRLMARDAAFGRGLARLVVDALGGLFTAYDVARSWMLAHPVQAAIAGIAACALALVAYRYWLLFWHNEVVARLAGTKFRLDAMRGPFRGIDVLAEIAKRPAGHHYVGSTPVRRWGRTAWRSVYLPAARRSMHRHVMGKTGSGKSLSVLWPSVLQAALDGQGVVVMSAKGSDEEIQLVKAIADRAGRREQLRVFALPAWSQPQLFSHTYNMVYVRPRTPGDAGGDPTAMADRVFKILPLGDNEFYNVQAQIALGNLCRLLHGLVDARGFGLPFNANDVLVCLRGMGGDVGGWSKALEYCIRTSEAKEAGLALRAQSRQLGKDLAKCMSGLIGALEKFQSPLVNAYAPDIVFEDVLEQGLIVYVQLPANLFPIQAPAIGRAVLMDIQQEGSLRQVFRQSRSQAPFSVFVDEFYNFADIHIIDSLNKLRDAKLEYTLAHQSIADLELVSREFAVAVWDNTRTKDLLAQDNPELCEKVAKSIGTEQIIEKTVRVQQGALYTSLTTGDASSKLVETFRLHPNRIKHLRTAGQGYHLFGGDAPQLVCYGMLPPMSATYALPRADQSMVRGARLYERFVAREADAPDQLSVDLERGKAAS